MSLLPDSTIGNSRKLNLLVIVCCRVANCCKKQKY